MVLPIDPVLQEVTAGLKRSSSMVIRAPTGAGKTTRVPPAILNADIVGGKRIVMLEPRRLAARAAARRMAGERGSSLGDEIGYQVRFERRWAPQTRILVVTEGVLVRMLQDDPFLEAVGMVIFDEFHERSLDNDLALAMVRRVQQTVRPDLRMVVMSATLAVEPVAAYLGDGPIVNSEGRQFQVEIAYEPKPLQQPLPAAVAAAVERLLDRTAGDVLVFLPGLQEIRQTGRQLETLAQKRELAVVSLYGDLPAEQQDAALLLQDRRKVVLATNVAETSITVEGITGVIDTGLARLMGFDARVGLDRLRLTPISRASADQRAGRAGRTQPGVCIRLWSELSHRSRPEETEPEIRRVDLAGPVLQLLTWGERDVLKFPWLEAPPREMVEHALELLRRLGACDAAGATELGRTLARLPAHPRLARLLVEGRSLGHPEKTALAAALLSERDPFLRRTEPPPRDAGVRSRSDVLDRLEALEDYERHRRVTTPLGTLNKGAARFILRARDQLSRLLRQENPEKAVISNMPSDEALLRALLAAFPDRIARRREPNSRRGVMVGGRGVRLAPTSSVLEPDLFACVDVDAGQTEALVYQASAIERDWLPAHEVKTTTEAGFDPDTERVTARRRLYYADLLLEESPAALPDDEQATRMLLAAAADHLDRVLPATESAAGSFLLRVRCLRQWMPELELPDFNDLQLKDVLSWLCSGCRSFVDLRKADWLGALQGKLTPRQRQAVEREAPERLAVPSGSHITLKYEPGRPPILAVRIQEMFGMRETPTVAAGRVRVLLHLLAPNFRPQQVTDDLASFWKNTYQQVRKQLRARYPKHAWPEDPWSAQAQRRPGHQ
jgi:ATP-dependent helicase HrpB